MAMHNFGVLLKDWRGRRRMSQLDLGLAANVSSRHVSFLETGRSSPSRTMVFLLSEALDIPRADRNDFLVAAGFAPAYSARDLADEEMSQIRAAVDWVLERHNPFPAMALDRHWTILEMNATAKGLLGGVGLSAGGNLLSAFAADVTFGGALENWAEMALHLVVRLRTESRHYGGDAFLDKVIRKIQAQLDTATHPPPRTLAAVTPTRYRFGDGVLSFVSTLSHFSTAEDIALAELRIELMFPADEATRAFLLSCEF